MVTNNFGIIFCSSCFEHHATLFFFSNHELDALPLSTFTAIVELWSEWVLSS